MPGLNASCCFAVRKPVWEVLNIKEPRLELGEVAEQRLVLSRKRLDFVESHFDLLSEFVEEYSPKVMQKAVVEEDLDQEVCADQGGGMALESHLALAEEPEFVARSVVVGLGQESRTELENDDYEKGQVATDRMPFVLYFSATSSFRSMASNIRIEVRSIVNPKNDIAETS